MLKLVKKDRILAHSDAYPEYKQKLHDQFDKSNKEYNKLARDYNLDINYFQTTIMMYDTSIIRDDTYKRLYDMAVKYPVSITNDQGIIALYFRDCWDQIKVRDDEMYYYDYMKRDKSKKYIMTKVNW
jgi:hypothetical protein